MNTDHRANRLRKGRAVSSKRVATVADKPGKAILPGADQWLLGRRRSALTREQETALAARIERATRTTIEAITRSEVALEQFALMVQDFANDDPECDDLATISCGREQFADEVLRAMPLTGCEPQGANPPRSAGRNEFVDTVARYGLSHAAVDELLTRLLSARDTCRASQRKALEAVIAAIRESHDEAERAKMEFVEANIPLVIWMATKKSKGALTTVDLVQEGCLGLIRAVEKFDHRRNLKFSTYAVWWVRHYMNRALSDQSRTIRIPVHLVETKHRAARLSQRFVQEHGRDPSATELSERMNVSSEKVHDLFIAPKEPISLDAPLGADGEGRVADMLADRESESALDQVFHGHLGRRLRGLLDTLTPREAEILRLRYGIDRSDCLTLQEVGERFSISRERTRQIEAEALAKLKQRAEAEGLDSYFSS